MTREAWFGQQRWAEAWARRGPLVAHLVPPLLAALDPRPGERILDIGAGDGQLSIAVSGAVHPGGHVGAVDISAPVLRIAAANVRAAGAGHIALHHLDAGRTVIPGSPFDAAASLLGVMFFDDPVAAFANIRSQLRPGGRMAVACWSHPRENPLLPESLLTPFLTRDAWSDADTRSGSFSLADPAHARGVLAAAGWLRVDTATVRLKPSVPAEAVFDDRLLDLYGVPSHRRAEALHHVEGTLNRYRTAAGIEVPLSVNVLTARVPG